ncbi:MAG: hypothetical protein ACOY31_01945 [Bacillota bacterium]
MEHCLRTLKKTRDKFLNMKNVIGVGVGMKQVGGERTKKPAVIIFVEKKVPRSNLAGNEAIPGDVGGVLTDVIEIGRVRLLEGRTDKVRPARPGVSIGHYRITAGTFGAVVRDLNTRELLILSNNHILANATNGKDGRSAPGDPIFQPAAFDGGTEADRIGDLLRFWPLMRSVNTPECPVAEGAAKIGTKLVHLIRPSYDMKFVKRYRGSNLIDAAVARPVSQDMLSPEIMEIGRPQGVGTVEVDRKIMKSGRSSGLTTGSVTALNVTLQVDLSDNEVGIFSSQVVSEMTSQGGDSGSLVLDERKRAVGLLFAGSEKYTVFNQLDLVLSKLSVELV